MSIAATNTQIGIVHFRRNEMKADFNYITWMAVTWCIWYHRNHVVFWGSVFDPKVVLDHAKSIFWEWLICKEGCNSSVSISD